MPARRRCRAQFAGPRPEVEPPVSEPEMPAHPARGRPFGGADRARTADGAGSAPVARDPRWGLRRRRDEPGGPVRFGALRRDGLPVSIGSGTATDAARGRPESRLAFGRERTPPEAESSANAARGRLRPADAGRARACRSGGGDRLRVLALHPRMTSQLHWDRDGLDWPNRLHSRFVRAGGLEWHVQQMGEGPALLLIHGTGASTHSWRDLAPRLAQRYTVLAVDLPGHAFTSTPADPRGLSLGGMATALAALVAGSRLAVKAVVGHSAGAAIAARMALDGQLAPERIVGLNAALLPLDGVAGMLFPTAARLMAATPFAARVFAWRASDRKAVERLIAGTGSSLDARGVDLYGRLVRDEKHVAAALGMMSRWELDGLPLERLQLPLSLLAGAGDRAVPMSQARRTVERWPASTLRVMEGVGHLAHEERPGAVADFIVGEVG